ncbi:hypothetical protein HO133_008401 [Letharia lupina]|uniref:Uncharacterized protein n=1 Tax=Letharia lupina TaxID=560253 RepID=A0A8H6CP38_9LECA|nr:uncharacterized protein HO133_008401 [Letharia lupina]KAF6226960.1 hypothetical protein HO133_008401 [Letharia lupina]
MDPFNHSLAPYTPNPPSTKPTPYPHAFGAFRSTRQTPDPNYPKSFDRKPTNSTYYLTFSSYYVQHLRPSPHCTTPHPSYEIYHKTTPASPDRVHDIAILREDVDKRGGVAVINYIRDTLTTLITYPKTGLTQDLVCDPSRFDDDDRTGAVVHMRDYLVRIGHECCVWQPLGPARASKDGTIVGLMELRNVMDGKLGAVLGGELVDGPDTKRRVMVRGEWAPGSAGKKHEEKIVESENGRKLTTISKPSRSNKSSPV